MSPGVIREVDTNALCNRVTRSLEVTGLSDDDHLEKSAPRVEGVGVPLIKPRFWQFLEPAADKTLYCIPFDLPPWQPNAPGHGDSQASSTVLFPAGMNLIRNGMLGSVEDAEQSALVVEIGVGE